MQGYCVNMTMKRIIPPKKALRNIVIPRKMPRAADHYTIMRPLWRPPKYDAIFDNALRWYIG